MNQRIKLAQVSDAAIRRFLLGQVSGREQSFFEHNLLSDDAFAARLRLAEFELSDDYAGARLGARESEMFRQKFLTTSGRTQMLNVSSAIRDRFATVKQAKAQTISQKLRTTLHLNQTVWRFAFAGLVLVLVLMTAWLVSKEPEIVGLIPKRVAPKSASTPIPQKAGHPTANLSPAHREQSPELPAHNEAFTTIVLDTQTSREKAPQFSLPSSSDAIVRLQLSSDKFQAASYHARLRRVDGEDLFSINSLKPVDSNPHVIDFDVPARILKAGFYQIILTRADGESTEIYYFRVQ